MTAHPGTRWCFQKGCQAAPCREANRAYARKHKAAIKAQQTEKWERRPDGCMIDPLTGRDVSDVIDDIARCLHPGSRR